MTHELARLGNALEQAAAVDLARRTAQRRPRRRLAMVAVAAAVAIPGAAFAAEHLLSNDDVAQTLPAGTLALAGTQPTCTTVTEGVEYRCVLAKAPAPEVADWLGTVEASVDASKHVNGGCRSLNSKGTTWECYIGQAAVDQKIISAGFLGEYSPTPGAG